jgi:hypothetical protein
MRILHAATLLAALTLFTGAHATAQSLGQAADKARRQREGKTQGKVFTEDDLRKAGGETLSSSPTAETPAATAADGKTPAKSGSKEKSPEELKAEASAAWRAKLERAQKEVGIYQQLVNAHQLDLSDTSSGLYSPRRAAAQTRLEEAQRELATAQKTVADLQEEGRRNGY